MPKELIKKVGEYQTLYRDDKTGIAWVEDGSSGTGHTCHPNIDVTGSVRGMKSRGFWSEDDRIIRSHGFYYNVSRFIASDDLDLIAAANCRCGGNHGKPKAEAGQ